MRPQSPTPTPHAATPSRSSSPTARTAQSSSRVSFRPCPALPSPLLPKLTACVLLCREHLAGHNRCPGAGREAEGGPFLPACMTRLGARS